MQIESLKVFCDLAETESFTKAAQINQVTQSAVSQQISSLERQFKSLLIERSKKKFRLTREGQVLYEYSKQIIQTFEALHSRLQEIKDSKLEIVPLRRDNMVLICHPQHALAKFKTVKLNAIIGQKFIAFEPDIPTRKAIDRILKDQNVAVQPVMEFDNIETVKRAVEIDAGISIVPQGTIMQEITKQTLAAVQFEDAQFFRQLAAIYKKNKVLSPAIKQFLSILKEAQ